MPKAAATAAKKLAPNHHHSLEGGVHHDDELLTELVGYAAEDADLDDTDAEHNEAVVAAAKEYDTALATALDELVQKYPPANGAAPDALWDMNGPFLVLMTLRGDEPDIAEGAWDEFYPSGLDDVKIFLEGKLSKVAVKLGKALKAAAIESCGNGDDEPGDEDEDDEDESDEDEGDADDDGEED